jgi:hypothetical protein
MIVFPSSGNFYQLVNLSDIVQRWIRYDIPSEFRYFAPDENSGVGYWYVHEKYLLNVIELAYKQTGTVDYSCLPDYLQMEVAKEKEFWTVNKPKFTAITKSMALKDAYAQLYLLPHAPSVVVTSVWRSLARLSHPDQGGDPELFRKYSEAYDLIKKESK